MHRSSVVSIFLGLLLATGAVCLGSASAGRGPHHGLPDHKEKNVCAAHGKDAATCFAEVVTELDGVSPLATPTYQNGYDPSDLANAYKWGNPVGSTWVWNGMTVAIVDAYDNPNASADLTAYRAQFGLPPCTTASGCFRKVNQNGATSPLPAGNVGWGQEIDLDIEMASAVCPQCKILLVEANSANIADLGIAVNQAATMGANAISNSYGTTSEFSGETSYDSSYYNHPGIAVTASSGDSGYGTSFPAASNHVISVGGTSLVENGSARGFSETAWSGAGSGCSAYFSKLSWQTDAGCARRAEADVSAVANPSTGVAVYDSYGSSGGNNWYVFGGTSVSAPIIAGAYALAASPTITDYPARLLYASPGGLFDVVGGSNGSCSPSYLCNAVVGFDGPTGLGTPNGLASFGGVPPAPDFSLAVSPSSRTVTVGTSAGYTVTVTPTGGFANSVGLSVSAGLPAGATATFTPPSTTGGTSALSITTSGVAPGTYSLAISGTDGVLTHTAPATLVVQPAPVPDFSISVTPSSRTVVQGTSAPYTVTVTAINGFANSVGLSVSAGLPVGATATFSPPSTTGGTSALSITTSDVAPGTYSLTISGTDGTLTHTAPATLVVQPVPVGDFTISVSPSSRKINQSGNTTYTVSITRLNGFTGAVSLAATGLISGQTASFSPNPITGTTSTLTLTANRLPHHAAITVTITGTNGSLSHSTTLLLTVK